MTFKHAPQYNSIIHNLLRQEQVQKWFPKPEPLTKTAAPNLEPTNNVLIDLAKLCQALRQHNLISQATQLEEVFFAYKRAEANLYQVSKETGEDLIHAAHPQGSCKLEGIDSDEAVIEDLIDKHLKIVKIVNKQPTGKEATQLIQSVKTVLAQTPSDTIKTKLDEAINKLNTIWGVVKQNSSVWSSIGPLINKSREIPLMQISRWLKRTHPTVDTLTNALEAIKNARSVLTSTDLNADKQGPYVLPVEAGDQVSDLLTEMEEIVKQIMANLQTGSYDVNGKLDELKAKAKSYLSLLQDESFKPEQKQRGQQWLTQFMNKTSNDQRMFADLDPQTKLEQTARFQDKIKQLVAYLNDFYTNFFLAK